jgi:hypothetical protein
MKIYQKSTKLDIKLEINMKSNKPHIKRCKWKGILRSYNLNILFLTNYQDSIKFVLLLEHCSPLWTLASNTIFSCIVFSTNLFLRDWDVNPMPNPQPGGPGCVSLLVWNLTLDLSSLGDPASSYATAVIALEIIGARKSQFVMNINYYSRLKHNITITNSSVFIKLESMWTFAE